MEIRKRTNDVAGVRGHLFVYYAMTHSLSSSLCIKIKFSLVQSSAAWCQIMCLFIFITLQCMVYTVWVNFVYYMGELYCSVPLCA